VDPTVERGGPVSTILDGFRWLLDPDNWGGRNGIGRAVFQHVWYSLVATVAAIVIAFPIGVAIGHTGRGRFLAANVSGVWRAIPTIGVVTIVFRWQPLSVWPVLLALVVLAIPPIVLNTVAGFDSVAPDVRDAAQGMGLTGWQSVRQVEIPNALPLILAGVRSATLQVIATATIAAYVGLGGLGRFIIDGYAVRDYGEVFGGSFVVAVLALLSEGAFALLQRAASPGVERRRRTSTIPTVVPQPQLGGT